MVFFSFVDAAVHRSTEMRYCVFRLVEVRLVLSIAMLVDDECEMRHGECEMCLRYCTSALGRCVDPFGCFDKIKCYVVRVSLSWEGSQGVGKGVGLYGG